MRCNTNDITCLRFYTFLFVYCVVCNSARYVSFFLFLFDPFGYHIVFYLKMLCVCVFSENSDKLNSLNWDFTFMNCKLFNLLMKIPQHLVRDIEHKITRKENTI